MATSKASSLKRAIRLFVSGTQFFNSADDIRIMEPDTVLSLIPVHDNPHDSEAISVKYTNRQIGWIPQDCTVAVRGIKARKAKVVGVGTDRTGKWTKLEIEITFKVDNPAAKVVAEVGPVVASIAHLMSPKDLVQAIKISRLPKDEQRFAIEEWNMQEHGQRNRRRAP